MGGERQFATQGRVEEPLDERRQQLDIAFGAAMEEALPHHQRKEQAVPIADVDLDETRGAQQRADFAGIEAPYIVDREIVAREQPAISGQVEQEKPARLEAGSERRQRFRRLDAAVA